ncbi:hypothetical protein C1646_787651 [Rhizophagus diaphanus]|nr:hypothetical protein C1646_787651 [Rhizophagus diaphanus] [Rhizophagus sp. MUCL 43196]
MKGDSLGQDLITLINNPKYSDIEILCKDEKKLFACKAILAARSEVFDSLLYNGMKVTYENQISFPSINSVVMKIIIEYIYSGSIKEESLTEDNIIEIFFTADYFQLSSLKDFIINSINNVNFVTPELLSKLTEMIPLTEDNILLNSLIEMVAIIPLNTIEFGRLSITGLKYLLSYTYEKEVTFATPEYEVFRYSVILAAKQVSNYAYNIFMDRLPPLKQIRNSVQVKNEFIINKQIAKKLKPLIKFIDFKRINALIISDIIEPLNIIPIEIIQSAYRNIALSSDSNLSNTRGNSINESDYVWDMSACGSNLIIKDDGKIVLAGKRHYKYKHRSVRGKMLLENKGIFEWDVIIEVNCDSAWVGVCSSENFNYEKSAGNQSTGWVLSSNGHCRNSRVLIKNYCTNFGDGTIVTVHLDMNRRTCAFTVNGKRYRNMLEWNNLPSKLYPVVSIRHPGRCRIQPHLSTNVAF